MLHFVYAKTLGVWSLGKVFKKVERKAEKRMAECIIYLKEERRKKAANSEG